MNCTGLDLRGLHHYCAHQVRVIADGCLCVYFVKIKGRKYREVEVEKSACSAICLHFDGSRALLIRRPLDALMVLLVNVS